MYVEINRNSICIRYDLIVIIIYYVNSYLHFNLTTSSIKYIRTEKPSIANLYLFFYYLNNIHQLILFLHENDLKSHNHLTRTIKEIQYNKDYDFFNSVKFEIEYSKITYIHLHLIYEIITILHKSYRTYTKVKFAIKTFFCIK